MKRIRVRPSKSASMLGFVVGLIFVGIGLFVAIPTFGAFGIFWTLIAGAICVVNGINAFTDRTIASEEIVVEDDPSSAAPGAGAPARPAGEDPQRRLRELRSLYEERLITAEEYEQKKAEILKEL